MSDDQLNRTLAEWLDHLEHRFHPEVQMRLENAKKVAASMNVLQWPIPVITVGGTNGKGSTVAALAALYQAAGYRVGQFTSPHLLAFNERISINQQHIEDEALCQLFVEIEAGRQTTILTYFEMSVLAALLYFKRAFVDVIILEVGLGGRLDTTNIIDADLSIITTVGLDHQAILGDDKEAIGKEKAGILRQHRPFIYADVSPPATVLAQAQALETELYVLGIEYDHRIVGDELHIHQSFQSPIVLPLPKLHPNAAAAAVMATLCLRSVLPVRESDWRAAMQTMCIKGRQQWIEGDVSYLYDVAHNAQAVALLAQRLTENKPSGKVHAIFSALKDKEICGLISPLSSIVEQWYPSCLRGKRATEPKVLQDAFVTTLGFQPELYADPIQAHQAAQHAAQPGDLILVYGSFVLVGAVMGHHNDG
ncbi:MAG: Mur ligase family protein [Gammaproteobacteria bacterium]|nr:Mur ligase family protein [Gammaproteobacteria bacterium]